MRSGGTPAHETIAELHPASDRSTPLVVPLLYRLRGVLDGEVVVDCDDACLVWKPGHVVPSYALPGEALSAPVTGTPVEGSPVTGTLMQVDFNAVDYWMEEDQKVFGHPRDPFKRLDIRRSSRQVEVVVDSTVIARSGAPVILRETGLPLRWYLPRGHVRLDVLEPSGKTTWCAYKGEASYYDIVVGEARIDAAARYYAFPDPEQAPVRDRICFLDEQVTVLIDGVEQQRPDTQWS